MAQTQVATYSGADRLAAWIQEQRKLSNDSMAAGMTAGWVWSMTAFAYHVGVSRQMVRNWTIGLAKPVPEHREALEEATAGGVPVESWD